MEPIDLGGLREGALLLVDSAPIIYFLEDHGKLGSRFRPIFEGHASGRFQFAVTTITVAEVLTGPITTKNEALTRRYRTVLESWQRVALNFEIAEQAAHFRAQFRLRLPDAVQAATAFAIGAAALVTHDRDFSRVDSLRVIS